MMSLDLGNFYSPYSSSPPFASSSMFNSCRSSSREFTTVRKDWSPKPKRSCMTYNNHTSPTSSNELVGCLSQSSANNHNINNNNSEDRMYECDASLKKVTFADSKGLALAIVKIFDTDDTDELMLKSLSATFRNIAISDHNNDAPCYDSQGLMFELSFAQPAADYAEFRRKLDTDNVCLENVIVQQSLLCGTVKVKNLAFDKTVGVRITYDGWKTRADHAANYLQSKGHDVYDTFSFKAPLPACWDPKQNIQFCIYYRVNGTEYWDSMNGENYKIRSFYGKCETGQMANSARWTEFQFWKVSFEDERPYW